MSHYNQELTSKYCIALFKECTVPPSMLMPLSWERKEEALKLGSNLIGVNLPESPPKVSFMLSYKFVKQIKLLSDEFSVDS